MILLWLVHRSFKDFFFMQSSGCHGNRKEKNEASTIEFLLEAQAFIRIITLSGEEGGP